MLSFICSFYVQAFLSSSRWNISFISTAARKGSQSLVFVEYTGSSGNSSQRSEIICIESKRSFSSAFVLCTATKIVSNLNVRQTNTKRSEKICERELNSYSTEYYALGVHKSLYRRGNIEFEYFNNLFRIFARLIERH